MKTSLIGSSTTSENEQRKDNSVQILKVRCLFRRNKYLNEVKVEKEHSDVEKSLLVSGDMLELKTIALNNLVKYMENKEKKGQNKLRVAYATYNEKGEVANFDKKTTEELRKMIFDKIFNLPIQFHEVLHDIFKSMKEKGKQSYLKFYFELEEMIENNAHEDE